MKINNSSGYIKQSTLRIIMTLFLIALIVAVFLSINSRYTSEQIIALGENETRIEFIERVMPSYIEEIEKSGYMNFNTKLMITEQLIEKFDDLEIEATSSKVGKGEVVGIIIKADGKTYTGKGIAK